MKAKHSPGPWTVLKKRSCFPSVQISPPLRYVDDSGTGTHEIVINEGQPPNTPFWSNTSAACLANAHLISAAPEMLIALEAWERWYNEDSTEFNRDTARELGLAAIRKAKGE